MALLSQDELDPLLVALPHWEQDGDHIVLEVQRPTFLDVMSLVQKVAEIAEIAGHHPDIDIRYNRLRLALSSHSEGGVTSKDLDLAGQIDYVIEQGEEQSGPPAG